jgi:hypothetical protein
MLGVEELRSEIKLLFQTREITCTRSLLKTPCAADGVAPDGVLTLSCGVKKSWGQF